MKLHLRMLACGSMLLFSLAAPAANASGPPAFFANTPFSMTVPVNGTADQPFIRGALSEGAFKRIITILK